MNKTGIEYTDYSWNVAPGCTKVNEGCVHCWAETMAKRLKAMGKPEYQDLTDERGKWTGKVALFGDRLDEPLRMRKPRRIVVNFMGDLFHPEVPTWFINSVFATMRTANWHTYFVLTKRTMRMFRLAAEIDPLPSVLLGTSIVSQRWADEKISLMEMTSGYGWRTWVSAEPLLGSVDFTGWEFLNFITSGGESGVSARPMPAIWQRPIRDWATSHGVPYHFKQWGEWAPVDQLGWVTPQTMFSHQPIHYHGEMMVKVGKSRSGRMLDGRTWDETPLYPPAAEAASPQMRAKSGPNLGGEEMQ